MINKKLFGKCLYKAENSQLLKRKISSYAGMQADKLCQQISLFENDEIIAEASAIVTLADSFEGEKKLPEIMAAYCKKSDIIFRKEVKSCTIQLYSMCMTLQKVVRGSSRD